MSKTNSTDPTDERWSRRRFLGFSLAVGAVALISACSTPSTCRVELVGMAGEHHPASCPHRFCRHHPENGLEPLADTTVASTGVCQFHSRDNGLHDSSEQS